MSTSWNQDCREKYQYLRYADDTTLMAESEEGLKSLLMKVKKLAWISTFKKLKSWHPVPSFHGKYAAGPFALFFIAEYTNIIIINIFTAIWFLGTSHNPYIPEFYKINFTIKSRLLTISFLWIWASYPRFRYDQWIHLLWKNCLPLTLALCIWHVSLPILLSSIPPQT